MDYLEKNNFIPETVSVDDLLILYILITVVSLILLIMVTAITQSSTFWIVIFIASSAIYLGYAYYLVSTEDEKGLYLLVSAALLWFVFYTIIQAITVIVYVAVRRR
jgi:uncharacterized membrane protein